MASGAEVEQGVVREVREVGVCVSARRPRPGREAVSRFLLSEKLRPIGIDARSRWLIVRDLADLGIDALLARIEQLRERIGDREAVNFCPIPK